MAASHHPNPATAPDPGEAHPPSAHSPGPGSVLRLSLFVLGLVVLCVVTSMITVRVLTPAPGGSGEADHQWLHSQLNLSATEEAALSEIEAAYDQRKQELQARFEEARRTVAQALLANDRYSEEVDAAVRELHQVHGDLQQLSIEHYYDMLGELPPEKQEKLKAIATDALSTPQ